MGGFKSHVYKTLVTTVLLVFEVAHTGKKKNPPIPPSEFIPPG